MIKNLSISITHVAPYCHAILKTQMNLLTCSAQSKVKIKIRIFFFHFLYSIRRWRKQKTQIQASTWHTLQIDDNLYFV